MKQIEKTASATNFTAINLGKLNELGDYLLELAPEIKIPGKVFGGAASHRKRIFIPVIPTGNRNRFSSYSQNA